MNFKKQIIDQEVRNSKSNFKAQGLSGMSGGIDFGMSNGFIDPREMQQQAADLNLLTN